MLKLSTYQMMKLSMYITVDTLERSLRLRFTDVYFRDASGWRQVAWQSTHAN